MTERDEPDPADEPGGCRTTFFEGSGALLLVGLLLGALTAAGLLWVAGGLLTLAFCFSLIENALQHHSSVRLMEEARKRGMEQRIKDTLRNEEQLYLGARLGRALFQLCGVATLAVGLVQATDDSGTLIWWALGAGIAYLLFLVTLPYLIARRIGHAILLRSLTGPGRVVSPFIPAAELLQRVLARLMRTPPRPVDPAEELEEDILSAVEEGGRQGLLGEDEKQMIEGVIDLRDVTADHVMTPRTEMVSLDVNASLEEVIEKAVGSGHSRLPVYRESPDQVIGVLYIKDLLPYLGQSDKLPGVRKLLRPPLFIPQSKNVRDLLHEMKGRHVHMAIVLDEYGGTAGVVTIEDVLEEIVGEIVDEHEKEAGEEVVRLGKNVATVEARTHIDDLNRVLGIELPEDGDYETVGGLLFTQMGRVPAAGEQHQYDGVRFTVLEADARHVSRIKVTVLRRAAQE